MEHAIARIKLWLTDFADALAQTNEEVSALLASRRERERFE
jgi:hypothetical protein